MPDLLIVGQPERAVCAGDDATQVAHVKRAAPIVEVGVGWEGVELERASSGDAPDHHVHRGEPERPVAASGDPAGRLIVRSVLRIGVKQVQLTHRYRLSRRRSPGLDSSNSCYSIPQELTGAR